MTDILAQLRGVTAAVKRKPFTKTEERELAIACTCHLEKNAKKNELCSGKWIRCLGREKAWRKIVMKKQKELLDEDFAASVERSHHMKCLSLTAPWSEIILNDGKRIENRDRWKGCSYRGPVLLHAAKGVGSRCDYDMFAESLFLGRDDAAPLFTRDEVLTRFATFVPSAAGIRHEEGVGFYVPHLGLARAGIVGVANIVDTIANEAEFLAWAGGDEERLNQRRWWFGGFALILDDVRPLPFQAYKGALGLFDVDLRKFANDWADKARGAQEAAA